MNSNPLRITGQLRSDSLAISASSSLCNAAFEAEASVSPLSLSRSSVPRKNRIVPSPEVNPMPS